MLGRTLQDMLKIKFLFAAVFCAAHFAAQPLFAQQMRAVLVGVSDYLYLDADLEGPKNDVGLMTRTLMMRGIAAPDITVLSESDAVLPAGVVRAVPDRATILATLDASIEQAAQGDTLIFYFSGHGAQAPDKDGDEGGGLDEIFLPRDAKGWNSATGDVENAILDDDFAQVARAAAAKGVALVAILDACHSGTGFRALGDDAARARYISPAALGMPDQMAQGEGAAPPEVEGDFVYLYAAQSDQRAFEYPVGTERQWHGDFTRALTGLMREVPDLTYAQLVQAAAQRMQSKAGQAVQTPDVEGPMADTPVFGGDAPGVSRIAVAGQTLMAGLLDDVTANSTLDLFAGLLDLEPVGQAVVEKVNANDAVLRYLDPFPTVKVAYAQITNRAVDASFSVSVTQDATAQIRGGIGALAARVDFDVTSADPTHRVVWTGDHLALVGRDGVLDGQGAGASPRLGSGDADVLAMRLTQVAGRIRLERALAQLGQGSRIGGFSLPSSKPGAVFKLQGGETRTQWRCAKPSGPRLDAKGKATASHCDMLQVTLKNPTAGMVDMTVLYVDSDSAIAMLWPPQNLSNRLESGAQKTLRFGLRNDGSTPIYESVIVLSVPATPGSPRTRFAALGTSAAKRAANEPPITAFLGNLTDPATSRGFSLAPKGGGGLAVTRLDLTLTPDPEH